MPVTGEAPAAGNRTAAGWLRPFGGRGVRPAADVPALVCLPHSGGTATVFAALAAAVAPDLQVLAVQYPGRLDRLAEPAVADLHVLADRVAGALRGARHDVLAGDRPLVLLGHSMGALLGYEVAQRLADGPGGPVALVASGHPAPPRHRGHRMDEAALVAWVRSLGGPGVELLDDPEVRELVLPALRADHEAVAGYRYRPRPRLRCPVTVLVGTDDEVCDADEGRHWADVTTGRCEVRVVPGGHFFVVEAASRVAAVLRAELAT